MPRTSRYSPAVRERAVRMVVDHIDDFTSEWAAIASVSAKVGMVPETLRHWVRRAQFEGGATVYELAFEFGGHRTTIAARLKMAGIAMRCQSPTPDAIDSLVRLYASGLSLLEVGKQLGFCVSSWGSLTS